VNEPALASMAKGAVSYAQDIAILTKLVTGILMLKGNPAVAESGTSVFEDGRWLPSFIRKQQRLPQSNPLSFKTFRLNLEESTATV